MLADFQAVADAGAVIVSGSQSHIPMAFEISKDSFIHYGLGNLFFDQAFFLLDIHTFYAGKHIGTEVLTIKFTNLAINRFMTMEERIPVLNRIFAETKIDFDLNQREANR
jgi:poly-gamma-glutamate synthesis protein (capsule biosynthesis protein)